MSYLPRWAYVLLFNITSSIALPQASSPSLPQEVAAVVPTCGQHCIASSIPTAWPSTVCSSPSDFGCLCSVNSIHGFTLGEIAVQCVASYCSRSTNTNTPLLKSIYGVCAGVQDARPNTHGTLTATSVRTSTTTTTASGTPTKKSDLSVQDFSSTPQSITKSSSSFSTRSTSATARTGISRSSSSPPKRTPSSISSSVTISHALPLSSVSPTPVAPAAQSSSVSALATSRLSLSSGQVAGISVASAVLFILLALGSVVLCMGLARRRKSKRDSDFLGFDNEPFPYLPRGEKDGQGSEGSDAASDFGGGVGPPVPEKPRKFQPREGLPSWTRNAELGQIGLAISPNSRPQDTPRSLVPPSSRATSKLLPDKPTLQPPRHLITYPRPTSEATYIEDERASVDGSMMGRSSRGASLDWAVPQPLRHSRRAYPPAPPPPPPPPAALLPFSQSRSMTAQVVARMPPSRSTQRSYQPGTAARETHRTRSNGKSDGRLSALLRLYTSDGPHNRDSAASGTSFESSEDDEGEAGGDVILSPLNEAAEEHQGDVSPISPERLHYPKVPRTLSGSRGLGVRTGSPTPPAKDARSGLPSQNNVDLLAGRRGVDKPRELRLQPRDALGVSKRSQWHVVDPLQTSEPPRSDHRPAAARQPNRSNSNVHPASLEPRGTPTYWTPKFTPTKRGDDLFLEVA